MTRLSGVAVAIAIGGCAGSSGALRGESEGPNVGVRVEAQLHGSSAHLSVRIRNRADDAIAVDLDAVRLRDAAGTRYRPASRHVLGTLSVAPRAEKPLELDWTELPITDPPSGYSLVLPSIYKLSIEGQIGLRAIRVPLAGGANEPPRAGATAAASAERPAPRSDGKGRAFIDPFDPPSP